MDSEAGRKKAEKFLPRGGESLAGAREKMRYLSEHTHIRIGIPLCQQIHALLSSPTALHQMGLTVQEVAQELSLNSKTCAKVLDRMIAKCEGVRATAHRYGRVYQYKYFVQDKSEIEEEVLDDDEYVKSLNSDLYCTLKSLDSDIQSKCRKALLISLSDKKHGSRIRVTHQNFIRSLFIMHKIQAKRVSSIFELKVAIKEELEPSIQWSLDKKTVLRIIWKLQRLGLIRQMCFRVVIKKHAEHVVDYLGDDYECIKEDKKRLGGKAQTDARGNLVFYKVLVALPEVFERDHEVLDYPSLQNPTRKKQDKPRSHSFPTHVKSRLLKAAIALATERTKALKARSEEMPGEVAAVLQMMKEEGKKTEETEKNGLSEDQEQLVKEAQRLFALATFMKDLLQKQFNNRYGALFARLRSTPEVTALKRLLNHASSIDSKDEISLYLAANPIQKLPKWTLQLTPEKAEDTAEAAHELSQSDTTKTSFREAYSVSKKLLLWLAHHPNARSLSPFQSCTKLSLVQVTALLQRLIDLRLVQRTTDGRLDLSKRTLPM